MKNLRPTSAGARCALACVLLAPVSLAGSPVVQDDDPVLQAAEELLEAVSARLGVGQVAPDFTLPTLDGEPWALADQAGKAVILEWVDPDCPMGVRQHSPEGSLRLLQLSSEGRKDVSWLAINSSHSSAAQSSADATRAAREKLMIDYPIALDATGWVGRAYSAEKATYVVLIDPSGKVAYAGSPDDGREKQLLSMALAHVTKGDPFTEAPMPARGCQIRYAKEVSLGSALPPLTFKTRDGATLQSRQFLGAPVVIEWFNPHCPVVQAAHGEGGALANQPAKWKEFGAQWMMVNSAPVGHATTGAANETKLEEWGLEVPVAIDPDGALMKAFGAKVTPHIFVLDSRGVLMYSGGHTDEANKKDRPLAKLLEAFREDNAAPKPSSSQPFGCAIVRE